MIGPRSNTARLADSIPLPAARGVLEALKPFMPPALLDDVAGNLKHRATTRGARPDPDPDGIHIVTGPEPTAGLACGLPMRDFTIAVARPPVAPNGNLGLLAYIGCPACLWSWR